MKDILAVLLAGLFVVMSLMSLLSAERADEATRAVTTNNQERVSDLGLRITFKR